MDAAVNIANRPQSHPQPFGGQGIFDFFRPFNQQGCAAFQQVVKADAVDVSRPTQAVTIQVGEPIRVGGAAMFMHDGIGWRGHHAVRTPTRAHTARKNRLARAHLPRKADDIAGSNQRAQPCAEPLGLFCTGADKVEFAFFEDWHVSYSSGEPVSVAHYNLLGGRTQGYTRLIIGIAGARVIAVFQPSAMDGVGFLNRDERIVVNLADDF